jgi:hypothetical protein
VRGRQVWSPTLDRVRYSSTKMLFERYAPFVTNALTDDGSRFERMMMGSRMAEKGRGIDRTARQRSANLAGRSDRAGR